VVRRDVLSSEAGVAVTGTIDRVRFPGLNALRFFAAYSVLIGHVQEIIQLYHKPATVPVAFRYTPSGHQAVIFFFALSGFLITFLLLDERRQSGRISVAAFYWRRVIRIWPLYFLTVFIGLVILPRVLDSNGVLAGFYHQPQTWQMVALLLVVMPNIANWYLIWPAIAHMWSIGVEEQFYAAWPWLLRACRNHVVAMLAGVVIVRGAVLWLVDLAVANGASSLLMLQACLATFQVECMAIGGIGAVYVFHRRSAGAGVRWGWLLQAITWVAAVETILHKDQLSGLTFATSVPLAMIFTLFIVNIGGNERNPIRLEHKVLDELGKVSYGIYMYHAAAIFLVVEGCLRIPGFPWNTPNLSFTAVVFLTTCVTLSAAFTSYYLFEKRFLQLRNRLGRHSNPGGVLIAKAQST
jgi:peptidoglycan/LPS O-acetylase OafA/YrhL